ncbi:MAG: hypothetical protein EOL97_13720 [Spirochaetia bacterium]|nr:hypothetical protein [Spirochaetia bacterium]
MSIQVKKIEHRVQLSLLEHIKLQLMYEISFRKKDILSEFDLNILTLLALTKDIELSKFCTKMTKLLYPTIETEKFAIKSQTIRNRLSKLMKKNYVTKKNGVITLNKDLNIVTERNMVITYNFYTVETNKKK